MITPEEIVAKLTRRRADRGVSIARMVQIRDHYHSDVVVPLPEIEQNEIPAVANLLNTGLEQMSLRVASVVPNIVCPPRKDTKDEREAAVKRRNALFGMWEQNRIDMKLLQRARHLLGYSQSYSLIKWDTKLATPVYRVADPLSSFPSDAYLEDHVNSAPEDCITVYARRRGDICAQYPHAWANLMRSGTSPDDLIEVAEYVDAEECVLIAIGTREAREQAYNQAYFAGHATGGMQLCELSRYPNRAEMVPVGAAVRMGLDRPMSKFEGMLGMYMQQAELMALEMIAVKKGIFADMWAVSRPGETVKIITPADGLRGIVGEVQGGELREMQTNPGFQTNPTIDRLERNQRVTAGIPADFGGESASNIRTGRRGDTVLSATIDFPIAEAQKMLARSLQYENKVAIALTKAYAGSRKFSFYVSMKNAAGWVDYTPNEIFTTDENIVSYSSPGADLNDLVVGGGQRLGMKTMSRARFMELDPLVEDPERERDAMVAEALDDAILQAISQQAATGAITPVDAAEIADLVRTNRADLAEAVKKVQEKAQKRQATPAPAGSPETMPGIAQPGQGAEQPAAMAPPGGLAGLQSMLSQLGAPAGMPGGPMAATMGGAGGM